MLKKNLVKKGFFGYGILLLVPNISAVKGESLVHSQDADYNNLFQEVRSSADSIALPNTPDSTTVSFSAAPEKNAEPAPQVSLNKHVTKFVKSFLKKEDESLAVVKKRSKSYFKMIDS